MVIILVVDANGRTSVWYSSHKGTAGLRCVFISKRDIWHSWFFCHCELPGWKAQVCSHIFKWYSYNRNLSAAVYMYIHNCHLLCHVMLCQKQLSALNRGSVYNYVTWCQTFQRAPSLSWIRLWEWCIDVVCIVYLGVLKECWKGG
jgi:hypothetical protein